MTKKATHLKANVVPPADHFKPHDEKAQAAFDQLPDGIKVVFHERHRNLLSLERGLKHELSLITDVAEQTKMRTLMILARMGDAVIAIRPLNEPTAEEF